MHYVVLVGTFDAKNKEHMSLSVVRSPTLVRLKSGLLRATAAFIDTASSSRQYFSR
jgi:hypothetical protein